MGSIIITARKNGTEKCSGCTGEALGNKRDTRTDMPFKIRFWLVGVLDPGELVPMVNSQELGRCWHCLEGPL